MRMMGMTAVGVLVAGTALADMPRYDPKTSCEEIAGGSQMVMAGCLQQEQESYNALKPHWDDLPSEMQRGCEEIAGGSYMVLKGCVQMELESSRKSQDFKFQY